MDRAAADVLGEGGKYWGPLWRVSVVLTPLERDLLRCWPVRRLAFIAYAGAASTVTTQAFSRLEHSLGVFALTAHFAPEDDLARAAALLHDVGHLPLSHTFEGVAGLDHHILGARRVRELTGVLAVHGINAEDVLAVENGRRPSVLSGAPGVLKLDHLDGLVRSGRAHGRTRQAPPATLARLEVTRGCVSTDATTAGYLVELVAAEARWHCSNVNVVASGVVRHLANLLLQDASAAYVGQVAAMTDEEFWVLLMGEPVTAEAARSLRRDPAAWRVAAAGETTTRRGMPYSLRRLYLDLPLVDGASMPANHPALAALPTMPWTCAIVPPVPWPPA
jgi:hypothetical protein